MERDVARSLILLLLLLPALAAATLSAAPPQESLDEQFNAKIKPIFNAYCYKCHGPQLKPKADLNLVKFQTERAVRDNRKLFKEVLTKVHTLEMPPGDFTPKMKPEERKLVTEWIDRALSRVDASAPKTAGRVVCRRLNRTEYRNTVRDLLGVDYNPEGDFPADDIGYGFDNIGDVLSLPPLLMEKYVAASRRIVDQAAGGPQKDKLLFTAKPGEKLAEREAARQVLDRFASRAFRRPALPEEVERCLRVFDNLKKADPAPAFEAALKIPVRALLCSPHFLFRVELNTGADGMQPLGDFELASRLSYFLWSSMPDDELLEAARKGNLRDPKNLDPQVARMLKDKRAAAVPENFAEQWLQIRRLEDIHFDPALFGGFDKGLREDMFTEVRMFFAAVMSEDRSVLDLLDADFTFVNDRLARHYGLSAGGGGFQRVKLSDPRRGGVMTMGAVLAATSDPNRTSPVKRGKWVLETILGTPPPPPIPDAANLKPEPDDARLTLRERMERHRKDPNCASCHQRMDPIGFGFENYDAVGAWRDRDGGKALDTAAKLPDGREFKGPVELKKIILERKQEFVECLTEKLMTYALGRGVEPGDGQVVDQIAATVGKNGYKFSVLAAEIVKSMPFQFRQKERSR